LQYLDGTSASDKLYRGWETTSYTRLTTRHEGLKLLAAASGTTVSEKIREAVDTMLAAQVAQVD